MKVVTRCLLLGVILITWVNGNIYSQPADTTNLQNRLDSLIDKFESTLDTDRSLAKVAAQAALKLSKASGYARGKAEAHLSLGRVLAIDGQFESALENFRQSIGLARQVQDKQLLFLGYKNLGTLYRFSGLLEDGLENYLKAMEIADEENLMPEKIHIYNNVALIYNDKGHFENAKYHLIKALKLEPEPVEKNALFTNLAFAYKYLGQYDSALVCYKGALENCNRSDRNCVINALANIGGVYRAQQEYNVALEKLFEAKKLANESTPKQVLIPMLSNIGMTYNNLDNNKEALRYFKEALKLSEEIKSVNVYKMHANVSLAYAGLGDFEQAWDHLAIHNNLKDSLVNENGNTRIEKLLSRFEIDKKENEIKLLNKEKELQETLLEKQQAEVARENQIRNITLIGSFVVLIPTLILLVVYRQKIKTKELLAIRNEEVNRQKTLQLVQEHEMKTIKAKIEGQEKERKRIASDLHDGIGGTLAGIKFNLIKLMRAHENTLNLEPVIHNIDNACHEVRTISHHLTPSKILNNSFIATLKNYIYEIAESNDLDISFYGHPEKNLNQIPDDIKTELYRIIQELLHNIVKHAQADHVDVQLTQRPSSINLMVEDIGVGFDASTNYQGIGLSNIMSRVNLLKGDFDIDSSIGRGTIVNIDIPINKVKIEPSV